MTKPGAIAAPAAPRVSDAQVADYLRRHPDFLDRHPELLAALVPAAREAGPTVVDMQRYVVDRLRGEIAALRRNRDEIVQNSRANLQTQQRIHGAALDLMNAESFEQFIETVTTDLALKLEVDAVCLCVEADKAPYGKMKSGVRLIAKGSIDTLMGTERGVHLRPAIVGERAIYGPAAELVKSDALVRLVTSPVAPKGLLAFGAREPGHFKPGQGTELLAFLGGVVESTMRAWLDLPG